MSDKVKIKTKWSKRKKIIITTLSVVVGYFLSMFVPGIGGYTSYPIAEIKCGGPPVIASDFMASYSYSSPRGRDYSGPSFLDGYADYYCTEVEAEQAGYRPNPYSSWD